MFWSDATHVTRFSSSQLRPCYIFIDNKSKYRWCKPSCNLSSHVAYFQKVGEELSWLLTISVCWLFKTVARCFLTFFCSVYGWQGTQETIPCLLLPGVSPCTTKGPSQWRIPCGVKTWYHTVIKCFDGILCQFYPCIFTYLANYPEK